MAALSICLSACLVIIDIIARGDLKISPYWHELFSSPQRPSKRFARRWRGEPVWSEWLDGINLNLGATTDHTQGSSSGGITIAGLDLVLINLFKTTLESISISKLNGWFDEVINLYSPHDNRNVRLSTDALMHQNYNSFIRPIMIPSDCVKYASPECNSRINRPRTGHCVIDRQTRR